jgi:hypothetical protein
MSETVDFANSNSDFSILVYILFEKKKIGPTEIRTQDFWIYFLTHPSVHGYSASWKWASLLLIWF